MRKSSFKGVTCRTHLGAGAGDLEPDLGGAALLRVLPVDALALLRLPPGGPQVRAIAYGACALQILLGLSKIWPVASYATPCNATCSVPSVDCCQSIPPYASCEWAGSGGGCR